MAAAAERANPGASARAAPPPATASPPPPTPKPSRAPTSTWTTPTAAGRPSASASAPSRPTPATPRPATEPRHPRRPDPREAADEALNPSADDAAALAVAEALNGTKGAPPKADSLAVLLSQALVAEDRALIERCLSVSDPTVVDNTVSRLAPHAATRLLGAALDRMRTKPARGEQLARWMRTVMLHHAGYIASSTKAQAQLVELQRTVESHVAMQRPLSSLLGRLDLLLHRRGAGTRTGTGTGTGTKMGR